MIHTSCLEGTYLQFCWWCTLMNGYLNIDEFQYCTSLSFFISPIYLIHHFPSHPSPLSISILLQFPSFQPLHYSTLHCHSYACCFLLPLLSMSKYCVGFVTSTCWRSVCVSVCCSSCITKVICACLFVHHYLFQEHHLKIFVFWFICVASIYYINVLPKKQCNWLFWLLMMVDWTLVVTITHMHWWWWASDENILIEPIFQHF